MAIEKLTKEKLIKYGFDSEQIVKLLEWDNYEMQLFNNEGYFFASNIENKIYTKRHFYTRTYKREQIPIFPAYYLGLIPEYYTHKFNISWKRGMDILGNLYIKNTPTGRALKKRSKRRFTTKEIEECDKVINHFSNMFKNNLWKLKEHRAVYGRQAYKTWLKNKN